MKFYKLLEKYDFLKEAFQYVLKHNGDSTYNPYHNLNHMMVVTEYVYTLGVIYLSPQELEETLLVALFHDFQHTAGESKDDVNIGLAYFGLSDFLTKASFEMDLEKLGLILKATQFPYEINKEDLTRQQEIIRDADLCQLLEPTRIQFNLLGLKKELKLNYSEIISGQINFVKTLVFNTQPGQQLFDSEKNEILSELDQISQTYFYKKGMSILDTIVENYEDEELLKADGFDDAVIGIATDFTEPRLVYSVKKCLAILEKDMNETDAMEHFTYNVSGGYVGDKTPIWVWDNFE